MSREECVAKIAEINALIEENNAEIERIERKIAFLRSAQVAVAVACVIAVISLCVIMCRKAKQSGQSVIPYITASAATIAVMVLVCEI